MGRWVGRSVLAIGVLHTVLGVVFFGDVVPGVIGEGIIGTVTPDGPPVRSVAFWFFVCGFVLLIVGGLLDHIERLGSGFPAFAPWAFLAIAALGCVLMPASGFWLLLIPVVGMFWDARLRRRLAHSSG